MGHWINSYFSFTSNLIIANFKEQILLNFGTHEQLTFWLIIRIFTFLPLWFLRYSTMISCWQFEVSNFIQISRNNKHQLLLPRNVIWYKKLLYDMLEMCILTDQRDLLQPLSTKSQNRPWPLSHHFQGKQGRGTEMRPLFWPFFYFWPRATLKGPKRNYGFVLVGGIISKRRYKRIKER